LSGTGQSSGSAIWLTAAGALSAKS
jgi:hypothetical protein